MKLPQPGFNKANKAPLITIIDWSIIVITDNYHKIFGRKTTTKRSLIRREGGVLSTVVGVIPVF